MHRGTLYSVLAGCLLLLALTAVHAGQNPYIRAYVSFGVYPGESWIPFAGPGVYEPSLYVDTFGYGPAGGGATGISFAWQTSGFGVALPPTYFPPGAVTVIGGPDHQYGWVVAWLDCAYPNACGFLKVLTQPYYATSPGTITLTGNPVDGKATVDCNNDLDFFCVAANAGIGMTPPSPDPDCIGYHPPSRVTCEPQGGGNPTHPPTYWYCGCVYWGGYLSRFSVQTFDPEPTNYTNWIQPPEWTHSVEVVGDQTWVIWTAPDENHWAICFDFRFDNPNPPEWGHWTMSTGEQSSDYASCPDGYGYRVHVPIAQSSAREATWGVIKGLYR